MLTDMRTQVYLGIAIVAFVAAVTGSDLFARITIGQLSFSQAFREHLEWASVTLAGLLFLLGPFLFVAVLCGKAQKKVRTRSVACIFGASLLTLMYFYFDGFQAAEWSMLHERWTAAALSVGLLPIFIGLPVVAVALGALFLAARFDAHEHLGNRVT